MGANVFNVGGPDSSKSLRPSMPDEWELGLGETWLQKANIPPVKGAKIQMK